MKKTQIILAVLVLMVFSIGLSYAEEPQKPADVKESAIEKKIESTKDEVKDKACSEKESAEKAAEEKSSEYKATGEKLGKRFNKQTNCPVCNSPINKNVFVETEGKRVYFCCESCITKFNEDSKKFMKEMEDKGIKFERTDFPKDKEGYKDKAGKEMKKQKKSLDEKIDEKQQEPKKEEPKQE